MPAACPTWFAADALFEGADGWYIGSRNGFCVGPYPSMGTAKVQSTEVQRRLSRAKDGGDMLSIVRGFLAHEHDKLQRRPPRAAVREGERPRMWYRADRCFAVGERWYFLTREGIDVGPYESKQAAQADARKLVRLLKQCATDEQRRLAIHEFGRRPVTSMRPH